MIRRIWLGLAAAALASVALADAAVYPISVRITGADAGKGQVLVSLFDSEDTYMKSAVASASAAVDGDGNARVVLGEHAPGDYAVVVVYDKNGNGQLDTGAFGIPKEKIGFSNNAGRRFGPAKWKAARFVHAQSSSDLQIRVAKAKE